MIAGRTTEDLFACEEIERRIGKASYDSLIKNFTKYKMKERLMMQRKRKPI